MAKKAAKKVVKKVVKRVSVKLRKKPTFQGKLRMTLYKVIRGNGTGGHTDFQYGPYLPQNGQPGKWLTIASDRKLKMCATGFHVTKNPDGWGGRSNGSRVFLVEVEGPWIGERNGANATDHKICCRKIRLTQEVFWDGLQWKPKAAAKTYTQQEVNVIVTTLKNKCINTLEGFMREVLATLS